MLIALDYDGTYTRDPEFWQQFVGHAKKRGHQVMCVTMRYPEESIEDTIGKYVDGVVYTSRQGKARFMVEMGMVPDVWIDDDPMAIMGAF